MDLPAIHLPMSALLLEPREQEWVRCGSDLDCVQNSSGRSHPPKRSSATRSFDAWFDSSRGCALREGSAREASGV